MIWKHDTSKTNSGNAYFGSSLSELPLGEVSPLLLCPASDRYFTFEEAAIILRIGGFHYFKCRKAHPVKLIG